MLRSHSPHLPLVPHNHLCFASPNLILTPTRSLPHPPTGCAFILLGVEQAASIHSACLPTEQHHSAVLRHLLPESLCSRAECATSSASLRAACDAGSMGWFQQPLPYNRCPPHHPRGPPPAAGSRGVQLPHWCQFLQFPHGEQSAKPLGESQGCQKHRKPPSCMQAGLPLAPPSPPPTQPSPKTPQQPLTAINTL